MPHEVHTALLPKEDQSAIIISDVVLDKTENSILELLQGIIVSSSCLRHLEVPEYEDGQEVYNNCLRGFQRISESRKFTSVSPFKQRRTTFRSLLQ